LQPGRYKSDLSGIFGVGLADGHVRILRWVDRILNRRRRRLRGNA
jgi:hypothetical protein